MYTEFPVDTHEQSGATKTLFFPPLISYQVTLRMVEPKRVRLSQSMSSPRGPSVWMTRMSSLHSATRVTDQTAGKVDKNIPVFETLWHAHPSTCTPAGLGLNLATVLLPGISVFCIPLTFCKEYI